METEKLFKQQEDPSSSNNNENKYDQSTKNTPSASNTLEPEEIKNIYKVEIYSKYTHIIKDILMSIETSNYEKAIISCKKLLFFLPEDINTYDILSRLYLRIYDVSSSIACLTKITTLSPENAKTEFKLNSLFFCKGWIRWVNSGKIDWDLNILSDIQASKQFNRSHFYYLRARAFIAWHNELKAIKDLYTILETDPDNEFALVVLAKILINRGDVKEGEQLMWRVNDINP